MDRDIKQTYTYHLFIELAEEKLINELFDEFFQEIAAERVPAYPIWSFSGTMDKMDYYVSKIARILTPLHVNNRPDKNSYNWKILLMGPTGYSGFSG